MSAEALHAKLQLARDLLGMDVAMLTEVVGGREVALRVEGSWPELADVTALEGTSLPLADTLCEKMLEGTIDHLVRDVDADPEAREVEMARALGVGAYAGVPIRPVDTRLYVLCCMAREQRPELDAADEIVLRALADSLRLELTR